MKLFIQVLNLNILNRDLELNLYRKIEIRKKKKKRKTKNKLKKEEEDEVVYSGTQTSQGKTQIIKHVKNLCKSRIKDENSVFYAADCINKKLINRAKKSLHDKDKDFG